MDTAARAPEQSVPDSRDIRVGEHIHQLLNLAHALVQATTTTAVSIPTSAASAEDDSPAWAASATNAANFVGGTAGFVAPTEIGSPTPYRAPFGMDMGGLTDQECVGWAQDLEHLARFQQGLAIQVAAEIAQRTTAGRYTAMGVRGPIDMLAQALMIGAGEASRRITLADTLLPTMDAITGLPIPASQAVLGEAFFSGRIGQEQALIVSKFITDASRLAHDGRISPDTYTDVQTTLVTSGQEEGPDFLRRIGTRVMSLLDPDGQKPGPSELRAKQGIVFRKARRGLVGFDGYLTLEQHEIILTIIGRFANPNHHKNINPDNSTTDSTDRADRDNLGSASRDTVEDDSRNETSEQANLAHQFSEFANIFTTNPTPPAQPPQEDPPIPPPHEPLGNSPDVSGPAGSGWESIWEDSGPLIPPNTDSTSTSTSENPGGTGNASNALFGAGTTEDASSTTAEVGAPCPGSGSGPGFDSGFGEMLAGLDPIDPDSTDPVVADDRTYAQKLLDGILDCLKLAARTNTLPLNGGLKAQLIIVTRQEDLDRTDHQGLAFTVHNGPVPLTLFEESLCDPEISRITVGEGQNILNAGRAERLFTPAQRKILLARDLGCCFPECTANALWCEAHHITPWQEGGETNINNAALLCSRHHSLVHHSDWTLELIDGTPYFTAPYLKDPAQTPRRNTYHHGLPKIIHPTRRIQGWN
ncbi:DUF222 domain-containing protein [Arthrobacter sp. TWP1-1]|uniref:HNH endonuclease signature motif containing protein n=1 Tax=Arthrobacter sp. TWP1-1 TaxID=2804568 RepID=UPI003CE8EC63